MQKDLGSRLDKSMERFETIYTLLFSLLLRLLVCSQSYMDK